MMKPDRGVIKYIAIFVNGPSLVNCGNYTLFGAFIPLPVYGLNSGEQTRVSPKTGLSVAPRFDTFTGMSFQRYLESGAPETIS